MANINGKPESPKTPEKYPDVLLEIQEWLQNNGFEEASLESHDDTGYLITNENPEFLLWVDTNEDIFFIKNIYIKNKNKGTGTDLVENLKEICRQNGFVKIIANKVLNSARDFWLDKCGFEIDMENSENAVFDLTN